MQTETSDLAWSFKWNRDPVTELSLAFNLDTHCWEQRARHDRAGWTDPVTVDLPEPDDEEHAERIAQDYADGQASTST